MSDQLSLPPAIVGAKIGSRRPSAVSFMLDPLPPLNSTTTPAPTAPSGTTQARPSSGKSSRPTTADGSKTIPHKSISIDLKTTSMTLHMCGSCQECLMKAFHHCLSKQRNVIPSTRELLEKAVDHEGEVLEPMPNLHPALKMTAEEKLYVSDREKLERDRAFMQEMKRALENPTAELKKAISEKRPLNERQVSKSPLPQVTTTTKPKQKGADDSSDEDDEVALQKRYKYGTASGTASMLLKQHLHAQQNEIMRLKSELKTTKDLEASEHVQIKRLQQALQKSLDYCEKANEWQEQESRILKAVIDDLKGEVSALMTYLLVSEQDKQSVRMLVNEANSARSQTEQRARELERIIEDQKLKLHHAFKDYLNVSEKLDRMTKEAAHGSEVARQRNHLLKSNLDTLSKDYADLNRTKLGLEMRIKDLEFELQQIVRQFNVLGEAKIVVDNDNDRLKKELAKLKEDHTNLTDAHKNLTKRAHDLDEELKEKTRVFEDKVYNLERRNEMLSKNFEDLCVRKEQDDKELEVLRKESIENNVTLKEFAGVKQGMEERFKKAETALKKDIQTKDQTIKELNVQLNTEKGKVQKLSETKEQLLFEVTDLKNQLEREQQNSQSLTEAMAEQRSKFLDNIQILEDRISKLETVKSNLSSEKKTLTESLRQAKAQIKQKEEDLLAFQQISENNYQKLSNEKNEVTELYQNEKTAHGALQVEHKSLQDKHTSLNADFDMVVASERELEDKLFGTKLDLSNLQQQHDNLNNKFKAMETNRNDLFAERARLKLVIEEKDREIELIKERMQNIKDELGGVIGGKDGTIKNLHTDIHELKDEMRRQTKTRRHLMSRLEQIIEAYRQLRAQYLNEANLRHTLELKLDGMRTEIAKEQKTRMDLERIHWRVDRSEEQVVKDCLRTMKERASKSKAIDEILRQEFDHLNGLYRSVKDCFDATQKQK